MSIVDAVRQPEYTGDNRCMPCTIANAAIAVVLSGALAVALAYAGTGAIVVGGAALAVLAVSAASIYLRGYLVPGTPELTERYFPEWVLAKFDKLPEDGGVAVDGQPQRHPDSRTTETGSDEDDEELDPERALLRAGAVRPCDHEEDLCLNPDFHREWREQMERTGDSGVEVEDILGALSMEDLSDVASLDRYGNAVMLERRGREIGKWESRAALVADVAAARALAGRYDRWHFLDGVDRSRLLRGLRIFAEECPLCSGSIELGQNTVESCCRSYEVVAVTCADCGARLFEQRWDGQAA